MEVLTSSVVEQELTEAIEEVKQMLGIGAMIDGTVCPGNIGIASQVLLDVMVRVAIKLNVTIPDEIYIFHDKKTKNQLTIREASQKFINSIANEKS
jgi:hypothetical protein